MKRVLFVTVLITILGVVAYITKPSEEVCIKKATEEFRSSISYTVDTAPKEIDKTVFIKLLEKNFVQKLEIDDKFLYRDIYQKKAGVKNKIGWAAFGWVKVDIKN